MSWRPEDVGPVYVATFHRVTVSAAQELFEILTPNVVAGQPGATRVMIREVEISEVLNSGSSTIGDMPALEFVRGNTVAGSGGTTAPLVNLNPKSTLTPLSTVLVNNTTLASGGTAVFVRCTGFNLAGGYRYYPGFRGERILVDLNQRLVVRLPLAPSVAVVLSGTLVFEEIGISTS